MNIQDAVAKETQLSILMGAPNIYYTTLNKMEKSMIDVVMEYTGGNQAYSAELLGIDRTTFRTKLKKYGML